MDADNPYAPLSPSTPAPWGELPTPDIYAPDAVISEGAYTLNDIHAIRRLYFRSKRDVIRISGSVMCVAAGLLALGLSSKGKPLQGIALFCGVILYLALLRFVLPRLTAKREWDRSNLTQEPFRRLITSEFVQTVTTSITTTRRWSDFRGYLHDDETLILCLAACKKSFVMIPRRTFRSDADWERALQIVRESVPPT